MIFVGLPLFAVVTVLLSRLLSFILLFFIENPPSRFDFCVCLKLQQRCMRSSHMKVFCKTGVLRYFAKFTGKHLCQGLFFNKVAGLRAATLLKKRQQHRCFPLNFTKFLRAPFLTQHFRWLILVHSEPTQTSKMELLAKIVNC